MDMEPLNGPLSEQTEINTRRIKNKDAVALGHLGGVKGGVARAAKLTPARRKEIAKNAILARWKRNLNNLTCPDCRKRTLELISTINNREEVKEERTCHNCNIMVNIVRQN